MDRDVRLDLLLRLLGDRPGITAGDLARELGISIRAVFRDLARLRDRGYPLEASRGRGGGLRLHPNWGLSRVLLSAEEALGALLALALAERFDLPLFGPELARARRKIVTAFPAQERRRLVPLRERLLVGPPASPAVRESYRTPAPQLARRLQAAFVGERVIRAAYVKQSGEPTQRRIEPHAILLAWPAWYLLGHDHLRGEARTFRIDRFTAVEAEPTRFRPNPRAIVAAVGGLEGAGALRWSL